MEPQLKSIKEETHPVYFKGKHLGDANYLEFLDLRVQIKKAQVYGYQIKFENEFIDIDRRGSLRTWPKGLFDQVENFLMELI
jgi:predicted ATPase